MISNWPLHLLRLSLCFSLWFSFSLCHAQVLHWAADFNTDTYSEIRDIQVGPDKKLYVTGTFEGTCDFDPGPGTYNLTSTGSSDLFFGKFDTTGAPIWVKAIEGPNGDGGQRIAVDKNMNILLAGIYTISPDMDPGPGTYFLPTDGITNAFVAKYNAVGDFLWANPINSIGWDTPYDLVIEGDDHVLLSGSFEDSIDFDPGPGEVWRTCVGFWDMFLVRYDRFGNLDWVYTTGGAGDDFIHCIRPDGLGKIIVSGAFSDTVDFDPGPGTDIKITTGVYDMFWAEFDTAGNYLGNTFTLGGTGSDYAYHVAYDPSGNFVVAGSYQGTVDFDPGPGVTSFTSGMFPDMFLAEYGPAGNLLYAHNFATIGLEYISDMALTSAGDMILTGYFPYDLDLDPSADSLIVTSAGMRDIFLAKYEDDTGALLWGTSMGSPKQEEVYTIAQDGLGRFYLCGSYNDTVDFDPNAGTYLLTNPHSYDHGYISKYRDEILTATQPPAAAGEGFILFPNPSTGVITVQSPQPILQVAITDMQGRQVMQTPGYQRLTWHTDAQQLSPGLYLVRISTAAGLTTLRWQKQ